MTPKRLLLPKLNIIDREKVSTPIPITCVSSFNIIRPLCKSDDDELSKDCGLGPAGFPKDLPSRHRRWRFPLSDLFALSPNTRLDYHLAHTVILNSPSRRNSLGVFLNTIQSFLASFAVQVSSSNNVGPLAFGTPFRSTIPPTPLKAGYTTPNTCILKAMFVYRVQVYSQAIRIQSPIIPHTWVSMEKGSTPTCLCRSPFILNPQQQPSTGVECHHQGLHRCALNGFLGPSLEMMDMTRILRHPVLSIFIISHIRQIYNN